VVDGEGGVVSRFEVEHTAAGLRELIHRLKGVEGVAIERPDGPVIDALLGAHLPVFVIPSRHVKALRTRHGLAGNKDDRADAYILADALRTDGHRLRPLQSDSEATVALRATVRARKDLVGTRVALVQQLSAHLALVFPGRSVSSTTSVPPSRRRSSSASRPPSRPPG
jgi:transposase